MLVYLDGSNCFSLLIVLNTLLIWEFYLIEGMLNINDNDINSEDGGGGKVDSNNKEEELFPLFKEEEGMTGTMTE
jgi:hypothetical protein